jgi:nucleoside-specific outer membrane channel protein Tsx
MPFARTVSPRRWAAFAALLLAAPAAAAAQTELQYQYGNFVNPFTGERHYASVLTFQHASPWSLGDSFIFIDWTDDHGADGFNEKSMYGEWYPTLSLGRVSNRTIGAGPIRDVALIGGLNFGNEADIFKVVPGGLGWDVGKAVTGHAGELFLGVEYQYWRNKLGVDAGDNVAQLWRM